jgi:mannitol/fructose-specific phosphotransferase system IIA component (Ntr-type)
MLKDILTLENIALNVEVSDWEQAIRKAGGLLYQNQFIDDSYIESMIENVKKMGAYIVISKGVALPHAEAGTGVKKLGISFIRLVSPVCFGNPDNDPVDLVFCLAAVDANSHLSALVGLSGLLSDNKKLSVLRRESDVAEVYRTIIEN